MLNQFRGLSLHTIFFTAALSVYAFFSSPTPDSLGKAEALILFFLVLATRFDFRSQPIAMALFCYGLTMPVLFGFLGGNDIGAMARDFIPFLFLLLPIFFASYYQNKLSLEVLISCIGVIFSLRALYDFGPDLWSLSGWLGSPPNLLYLANSPEVLFSFIFLTGIAGLFFFQGKRYSGFFLFIFSLAPLLAMASAMQRASFAYIIVCALCGFYFCVRTKPKAAIAACILFSLLIYLIAGPFVAAMGEQLFLKTKLIGLNSRVEEWQEVWSIVSRSWTNLFFGLGWGAELENPAVGGLRVNFTHSLISSLLLKTGLIGIIIFVAYGFLMLRKAWPELMLHKIILFSLAGPLLIGFALYASYKSLGYGLLILLLSSFRQRKELEQSSSAVP